MAAPPLVDGPNDRRGAFPESGDHRGNRSRLHHGMIDGQHEDRFGRLRHGTQSGSKRLYLFRSRPRTRRRPGFGPRDDVVDDWILCIEHDDYFTAASKPECIESALEKRAAVGIEQSLGSPHATRATAGENDP